MKIFVENWNGVLDIVEDTLREKGELTDNPHEADAFLMWQDVRGTMLELAHIAKYHLKKPVIVMQHGRGATRDYCPPNSFPSIADKILVWGDAEKRRLMGAGISDSKIEVVGCPMIQRLKPKNKDRQGKNVLFVPIIASKEEPENILVYGKLKIWESEGLIKTIYRNFDMLKRAWAWENNIMKEIQLPDGKIETRLWKKDIRPILPRWVTYGDGLLNVKLASVHDQYQYQSALINTPQNSPNLIDDIVDLLSNTDVMVCLEEGTMQLLACALNIPVILVDIFKYANYGGCENYDKVEKILTKSVYLTRDINKIGGLVDHALTNPNELMKHRIAVCEDEGGAHLGDINQNIIKAIEGTVYAHA